MPKAWKARSTDMQGRNTHNRAGFRGKGFRAFKEPRTAAQGRV